MSLRATINHDGGARRLLGRSGTLVSSSTSALTNLPGWAASRCHSSPRSEAWSAAGRQPQSEANCSAFALEWRERCLLPVVQG